jgi:hypothetical protein
MRSLRCQKGRVVAAEEVKCRKETIRRVKKAVAKGAMRLLP